MFILTHLGREYHFTGKTGKRYDTGLPVWEYTNIENGVERRVWATADGRQVFPD